MRNHLIVFFVICCAFNILRCKSEDTYDTQDAVKIVNVILKQGGLAKEFLGKPDTIYIIKPEIFKNDNWPNKYEEWHLKYVDAQNLVVDKKKYTLAFPTFKIKNDSAQVVVAFINARSLDTFTLVKRSQYWKISNHYFTIH